jgi:hypothetical protein
MLKETDTLLTPATTDQTITDTKADLPKFNLRQLGLNPPFL